MSVEVLKNGKKTASILFDQQKKKSLLLRSEPISERKKRIKAFGEFVLANQKRIQEAVYADLGKPHLEVDVSEIYPVMTEIRHTLAHLNEWVKPVKIDAPLTYLGTRSEIRYEAKGVCLIISPWNFPINLCFGPLISCLAAGNTAILKPSELTPRTSQLIEELVREHFDEDLVTVVEGGPEAAQELLSLPFDHIFFTGSPAIGKIVMKAAAENLSSVTLELGGKSPTVIDSTANIDEAARRIAFGKFLNNGQTCIAPDYILVEEKIKDQLITSLKKQINHLFGENDHLTEKSPNYSRIVNERHFQRLSRLVENAVENGAKVEWSGAVNADSCFMHPVILSDVPAHARIMEQEIFGPVLPVLTFNNENQVVHMINHHPKPLALYIFSQRKAFREKILAETSAGSVCINDCVLQFTHPNLPFGGVNNSGIGKAHGHFGFIAFSNEKPVLKQKGGFAISYFLHPPYSDKMKKLVQVMLRWF